MSEEQSGTLSRWSLVTIALAVPVWWFAAINGVMSRSVDGGIFLSVTGGIEQGLGLYAEVWDNKDPLFYAAMVVAHQVSHIGPFVLDWLWLPLAALGTWLISRRVTSGDRALFLGLVAAPLVLTGPAYAAGWTNTPGTALTLLALGLLMARRGVLAGVVLALLLFTKLVVWPIAALCLIVALVIPDFRRVAWRALAVGVIGVGVILAALSALDWLVPYLGALQRNSAYSSDVITYFAYDFSIEGRPDKFWTDVGAPGLLAIVVMTVILIGGVVAWVGQINARTPERFVLLAWFGIAFAGSLVLLAFTYVWPHHAQVLYLPGVLGAVALAAGLPDSWPFIIALPLLVVASWLVGAWGTPSDGWARVQAVRDVFPARWAEMGEVPKDARLLASVPRSDFTYARLGTNDDRGYLLEARPNATLACPQFHLYDFSPEQDFVDMLGCIQDVDVILMTDSFVTFGNGWNKAVVQPILQYVQANFDCLRVDDRQVCTRKPV